MEDAPLETEQRVQRQLAVESALASARLDGAEPSEQAKKDMASYIAGDLDTDELIARARGRYGLESP